MYDITVCETSRLVILTLEGFWSVETAEQFTADEELAVARLGPPFGTHLTLADVRRFEVQRREVVDVIRNLVVNARSTSKRLALVGKPGLAKLQFARIADRDESRIFDDMEEAKGWLLRP